MTAARVSWHRDRRLPAIVLVVATLAAYGATIRHDFVGGWDDGPLIVNNDLVNPPTTESLRRTWTAPHARMYIPAVYTTWWMLARLATVSGEIPGSTTLNPAVFHAANVLVHAVNTLLVYAILQILLTRPARAAQAERVERPAPDWPAAAGAMLFALHPLQVEAVAWATGMKDLLWGFFALLALWQYFTFVTGRTDRPVHYALATLAFVAALLAKPSAVVVPFIAVILDAFVIRGPTRRAVLPLLPWFIIAIGWMVLTAVVQPTPEITRVPLALRPLIAIDSIGFYLYKLVWPASLGVDYGMRPDVIGRNIVWVLIVVAALVAIARTGGGIVAVAFIVFVAGILPVLGLTPFVFQWLSTVADRYVYLSMLGPALAVAYAMTTLRQPRAAIVCAILLAALGVRTIVQAATWRDAETLMRHALKVNPASPLAHNQLGDLRFNEGDLDAAHDHFAAAVATKGDFLTARDNLASTLVRLGRHTEALAVLLRTLELRRSLPPELREPTENDERRIAAVERLLAREGTTTSPKTTTTTSATRATPATTHPH